MQKEEQSQNRKHSDRHPLDRQKKPSIDDFICICQLGRGSYGEVVLGKQKNTDQEYAIKIIDKRFMAREKKQYQVFIEREMLFNLKHPGIVHLYSTFQTHEKLYFVMEYLNGGDFAEFIKIYYDLKESLSFQAIQFYMAEIVLILEFLHANGIAHRDVKPENILLTKDRHLKFIDFGTSIVYDYKMLKKELAERIIEIRQKYKSDQLDYSEQKDDSNFQKHRATFVGTAEYVSPELLEEDICQGPADLWALGCICYKLLTGKTPFYDASEFLIFQNVKQVKFSIPEGVPEVAASLIRSLIKRDPNSRLGAGPPGSENDYNALKRHEFFQNVDFLTIFTKLAPQYKIFEAPRYDTLLDPDLQMGKRKTEESKSSKDSKPKKKSKLLFYGLVQLKMGWLIYKPVDLVLYEGKKYLKLIFYDPESEKSKAKIRLKDNVTIKIKGKGTVSICQDSEEKHVFKEIEHSSEKWLEIIEKARLEKKNIPMKP